MSESVETIPPVVEGDRKDPEKIIEKKIEPTTDSCIKGVADNIRVLANLDNNIALQVVTALAKEAGLLDTIEKKSVEETNTAIDKFEELQKKLSEENPELATILVDGMRELVKDVKDEVQNTVNQRLSQIEESRVSDEVTRLFELPEIKEKEKEILELMDTVVPRKGVGVKKYITTLAKMVQSKEDIESNPIDKIRRNFGERSISSGPVDETTIKKGPSRPTLRQSLEAAMQGIKFDH